VAIETTIAFHTRDLVVLSSGGFPEPETVTIEFENRRFVWHVTPPTEEGDERWPTVTTMIEDPDDYEVERLAMARLLSAIAFETQQGIEVLSGGAAGVLEELDRPVATALRRGVGSRLHQAPAEVVVADDERLRLVLGYYREGVGTGSPYFRFLAFWNALDVACEDLQGGMGAWIRDTMNEIPGLAHHAESPPADWWEHLLTERRHAVAHAVRDPERGVSDLDPDDPESRARFYQDARLLDNLVGLRVRQRWGDHAVYFRQQQR
jgi:hypothetical protein